MSQNAENGKVPSGRLAALDALRGFDMFWIMGGFELLAALGGVLGFANAAEALDHVPWHGHGGGFRSCTSTRRFRFR